MQGWKYIEAFGYSAAIYGCKGKRRLVDIKTGEIIVQYPIKRR